MFDVVSMNTNRSINQPARVHRAKTSANTLKAVPRHSTVKIKGKSNQTHGPKNQPLDSERPLRFVICH